MKKQAYSTIGINHRSRGIEGAGKRKINLSRGLFLFHRRVKFLNDPFSVTRKKCWHNSYFLRQKMILISTHGRLWISFLCGICQWPFTLQQLFLAGYISLNCLFFLLWYPFIKALPFAVPWKSHALSGFSCESLCFVSCMGEWSAITQEGSFLLCNARIKIARYCIKCI